MKNNRIYPAFLLSLMLLLGGCATDTTEQLNPEEPTAPILNLPEGAAQGQILIKFNADASRQLDKAQATRSGNQGVLTRSGIAPVDRQLDRIGAYELERIFPVDQLAEEGTRQAGLHLWYIIHFDETMDLKQVAHDLSKLGDIAKIEYNYAIQRSYTRPATPLKASKTRTLASRNGEMVFDDPDLDKQWHYINRGDQDFLPTSIAGSDVGCATAWKTCTGDPSVIVAVMDEGVAWSHPDLNANMWRNEGEVYKSFTDNDGNGYKGDYYGYNFSSDSGVITFEDLSDTGHGTHVAGTIAAVNNNGVGVCGIAGGDGSANSGVKIMSLQIFAGNKGTNLKNEAKAIKYAADNGAVILQCSWGYLSGYANPILYNQLGPKDDEEYEKTAPLLREAFDYFIHNAGSPNGVIDGGLVVFASGNENAPGAAYPGAYTDYICVSAITGDYSPASYTNYRFGVDISAPGGDADRFGKIEGSVLSTLPENLGGYGYMDGTSMACPHVSGVAALGLAYAAKQHKHFRAKDYQELLLSSTQPLDDKLTGKRLFYFNTLNGVFHPSLVDISYYKGKMGRGVADAGRLLANIANEGVQLVLPNVYVAVGNTQIINLGNCFNTSNATTSFTPTCSDTSIATARVDGHKLMVEGKKVGRTSFQVTSSEGQTQTAFITVRDETNDNGWL